MKNRRVVLTLVMLCIVIVALVLLFVSNAPATSSVETTCITQETGCLQLPTIIGANLDGTSNTFPSAFTHPYQLVVMPFNRDQQTQVLDFVPLFQELSASRPDLGYYSLAALPDLSAPIRLLVSAGMNAVVTDPLVREAAYIFYLEDQAAFLQALNLPNAESIRVYVLDQMGNVLWQGSGSYTPELADQIRAAIETLPRINS